MISIITSLYKSDKYLDVFSKHLENFANFLIKQGIAFELIAIANDPTEREKKFATDFQAKKWFKFVSVGREPLYATWNRGVELAGGEVIGFWNVDDVRYPEAIIDAQSLFTHGAELVYFPFKICRYLKILGHYFLVYKKTVNAQIPEFTQANRKDFLYHMNCGPFFMFTKTLYAKVGPFDEQFKIAGDFDWCARAAKISEKFVKSKIVAGEFRVDGGGLSSGWSEKQRVENDTVYRRQGFQNMITEPNSTLSASYNPGVIKCGTKEIPYV